MKLKQLLLTSTAVLMLGTPVAPLFAQSAAPSLTLAQAAPPALAGAIQTYLEAQAAVQAAEAEGGDVAAAQEALAAAEGELGALCAAMGQNDIDACIAMFEGGEIAPAAPAPEAEISVEAEGEAAAEDEAPAPEAEPAQEPAPVEAEPAPAEQPAPEEAEPEPVEQPAPAPVEEPEPAEEAAPEPEPAPIEEPAPQTMEEAEPAPEAPAEEAAPPAEQPAAEETSAVPASLLEAVAAYETAVAEFEAAVAAGEDTTATAQAVVDAEAELRGICEALGQSDLDACLSGFDIELDIVDVQAALDGMEETPPAEAEPAPAEGQEPAEGEAQPEGQEPAQEMDDDIVLEGDIQGEIVPEGIDASEVAPLLDSEKDAASEASADAQADEPVEAEGEVEAEAEADVEAEAPAEEPAEPAPAAEPVDVTEIPSIDMEEGQDRQEVSIQQIEEAASDSAAATLQEGAGQQQANQQGGVLVGPVREGPSNAEVIATIGLATIFAIGANQFIDTPDTPRIVYPDDQQYYVENLSEGRTRETILRADGSRIVTIRDQYGDVIRRSRIEPDGREILLVYVDPSYRRYDDQGRWIDPGRQLPPLVLNIPPSEYVLNASSANEQQVATFLDQPPVETIQRYYTIDEVKRSSRLRDMVRRLEIADLTFDTGSANISQSEIGTLSATANAMLALIAQNPAETFLIEGHTDAVGSDISNLALSDRRAEAIAYALTRVYGVPAENLATQGYGERYLKVNTQAAERTNRRVTIRRITPLITPMNGAAG
ncbi:OmpA family protein [Pelagibacterium halotolerans]|uniref:Ferric siderophore transport system, periplasmic binding protein TonB n=1 Tax=Pelagibacterium halotolerans (strain DSM 22347 / JCM 15775 / CGMCC 1.7692 / B2) TaxID=1082931 RepID=G4RGR6_PELHB|nr:OmpA family protein [Pelagibacterium halotolerans]AEQ52105.1 ferric siderophore transport system, periplasmic binding protein TonB [Pelagibacterium halotolerans B2]QJR18124.1 OmpA family protein [Pelagibacterium halotolerans]SDZ83608.1 Outer membrane protein OmpA [Pelagibacterium halotolerans]